MKDVLKKGNIPTATYEVFSNPKLAKEFLEKCDIPIVLKADGLAGGKGVIVAFSREEALEALNSLMIEQKGVYIVEMKDFMNNFNTQRIILK